MVVINQLRSRKPATRATHGTHTQIRGIGSGGKTCPIGTWHGLTKTWKNPGDVSIQFFTSTVGLGFQTCNALGVPLGSDGFGCNGQTHRDYGQALSSLLTKRTWHFLEYPRRSRWVTEKRHLSDMTTGVLVGLYINGRQIFTRLQ
jgi:hypothetical protein